MKKILNLILLTISCLISAQNLIAADSTTDSSTSVPILSTLATSKIRDNGQFTENHSADLAIDLHDTLLKRRKSIAVDEFVWDKKASWGDLGYFLWSVTCYGIEKKILGRKTANIEAYVQKNITTYTSLTPEAIEKSDDYAARAIRALSCFVPADGAEEFLKNIKSQGHRMFLFSNIGPKSYKLFTRKYPAIMSQFDNVAIIENNTISPKPDPTAYQHCLDIITNTNQAKPEVIVFYDDDQKKLKAATDFIAPGDTKSRFIPVLYQSSSPAEIAASRALLLDTLSKVKIREEYNPDKLRTID
ncbi:MAG TPA: HAD family hydrolase [Candidatus Babeliales bacterium]|nr:HAD family hydrolase [Candidatus Babeliales bacterium]